MAKLGNVGIQADNFKSIVSDGKFLARVNLSEVQRFLSSSYSLAHIVSMGFDIDKAIKELPETDTSEIDFNVACAALKFHNTYTRA